MHILLIFSEIGGTGNNWDSVIYYPAPMFPILFREKFPTWNFKYLTSSPGVIFQRCGSDNPHDPEQWKVTTISTPGTKNACNGKFETKNIFCTVKFFFYFFQLQMEILILFKF